MINLMGIIKNNLKLLGSVIILENDFLKLEIDLDRKDNYYYSCARPSDGSFYTKLSLKQLFKSVPKVKKPESLIILRICPLTNWTICRTRANFFLLEIADKKLILPQSEYNEFHSVIKNELSKSDLISELEGLRTALNNWKLSYGNNS